MNNINLVGFCIDENNVSEMPGTLNIRPSINDGSCSYVKFILLKNLEQIPLFPSLVNFFYLSNPC